MLESKFKQTKIGLIPEGWEVKPLGEVVSANDGYPFNSSSFRAEGKYAVVRITDIVGYDVVRGDKRIEYLPVKIKENQTLRGGEILVAMSGSTGKAGYNRRQDLVVNQRIAILRSKDNTTTNYLRHLLLNPTFEGYCLEHGTGTQNNISKSVILNYLIPFPPLKEQKRIGGALSAVDELLASLDKQIAKTRDIRQGAMQQLLTGAKRLKGFSGQWTNKKLGGHADIYRGGSPRPIESFITDDINGINWIKIGDVDPAAKYIRSTAEKIKPSGVSSTRLVHKGDLILSNSMSFGRPYILKLDGAIHDGWLVIQNYQKTFNTDFLHYALSSDAVMAQYKTSAAGSSVQNLNKGKVAEVVIHAPDSLEEQKHIADVLTSFDDTIEGLEAKRQKYESIKAGMMQQLLTGTIRLS